MRNYRWRPQFNKTGALVRKKWVKRPGMNHKMSFTMASKKAPKSGLYITPPIRNEVRSHKGYDKVGYYHYCAVYALPIIRYLHYSECSS
jgi:hypothetical protein